MKDNQAKYPQLRFKGFTDPWEQRKLSDFSKTTYGGGTPKTAVTEYWDGNIPWIQSSNLTVDDVQEVNLDKFITDDAIKNSAAKLIPANSIAIVTRVGVGKLTLMKQEFATSQDFLSLSELHVDEQFGLYSIYKLLQKELNNIQGTSIKGMTKADLLTKDIMIPVEKDEQIKIGSFFKQLDHLITLHQRKLAKLKELKQGYLQKLFPRNGSKFPQLRFAGFADAWEQRKLKDTLSLIKDGTHGTHKDGNFSMLLSTKNLINGKVVFNKSKDRKIGKKDYDSIFKGYSIHEKDVLLSVVGSIGRLALYYPQDIPIAFQRSVAILRGNKSLEQEFLKYVLETHDAQRQLKMRTTMSAQPDLFLGDLSQVMIKVPIFKEQIKIIKIFDSISNLIASNQRKLEKLQELKKGYLQKMFC
nr:restriction endonuclease subunit S [Levilactobacillus brevis]